MSTHGTSESHSDDEVNEYVELEESDKEEGPSGRLSRLNRPTIAPAPKRRRFGGLRRKPATAKAKGKGKGRNHGKLAQLMEMPLDVLFEITSQLEPLDILQLSRVSKRFRTIFASKGSKHIWVAARKNLPGMPDCPHDLSEPQYASLMFEHNCHACGKPRSLMADYSLRVNFCTPCFKTK
ncbi:hypothetical protein PILCRDRAFT_830419 [Piloderma croceum F 1598]|uniref:F-box domain-containing protein n=1 Tax=Piloderma croceum (strain F 1598) TaxID=765440 RepID=A0A0C3EU30_PILCF|nr:hypothetical protein PILCRDRAFT_830419 [Piloderma croceum F 1598]